MKGLTADQAWMQIKFQINLVQDSSEKIKLNNLMLKSVESRETKKARISAQLDKIPRYQIKPGKSAKK